MLKDVHKPRLAYKLVQAGRPWDLILTFNGILRVTYVTLGYKDSVRHHNKELLFI